jgi:hypothetical protein
MCVVGEKKKERQGSTWVVGKKKGKKKEKRKWGVGFTCIVRKKEGVEKKEEKKFERKKLNWFYLYVHFVWCKV